MVIWKLILSWQKKFKDQHIRIFEMGFAEKVATSFEEQTHGFNIIKLFNQFHFVWKVSEVWLQYEIGVVSGFFYTFERPF